MDVHNNPDFHAFVAAYASFVTDVYKLDTELGRLVHIEPGNYQDIVNIHLDWAFQDLVRGYRDRTAGDDLASEWLLDKYRHLWGRAWLALPISVRSKYKQVGG